jgi:hypothetical protein
MSESVTLLVDSLTCRINRRCKEGVKRQSFLSLGTPCADGRLCTTNNVGIAVIVTAYTSQERLNHLVPVGPQF